MNRTKWTVSYREEASNKDVVTVQFGNSIKYIEKATLILRHSAIIGCHGTSSNLLAAQIGKWQRLVAVHNKLSIGNGEWSRHNRGYEHLYILQQRDARLNARRHLKCGAADNALSRYRDVGHRKARMLFSSGRIKRAILYHSLQ